MHRSSSVTKVNESHKLDVSQDQAIKFRMKGNDLVNTGRILIKKTFNC